LRNKKYRSRLEDAEGYSEVWEIVKDTVKIHLMNEELKCCCFSTTSHSA
jgi:hypothetical protein